MIKMSVNELVFEVKEEILCYEQLGESKAEEWERNFNRWLNDKSIKKPNIIEKGKLCYYCIEDESAVFDIVDEYLEAVENNKEEEYWKNFR